MLHLKFKNFPLLLLIFLGFGWASASVPRLVLVNGASCSGKSTLTQALAANLGTNWIILDRDELENNGVPEEKIDRILTENICGHLTQGNGVIVDTHTFQPLLYVLTEYHPITVFIYAMLPVLIERDTLRQQNRQRSEQRQKYARAFILDTFVQLLTFSKDSNPNPLDVIHPSDVDINFLNYPIHDNTYSFFHKIISTQSPIVIYPNYQYDVIIRSDRETIKESVLKIASLVHQS